MLSYQEARPPRQDAGHRPGGGPHVPGYPHLRAPAPGVAEAASGGADVAHPVLHRGGRSPEELSGTQDATNRQNNIKKN